jgi:hypothetical protein
MKRMFLLCTASLLLALMGVIGIGQAEDDPPPVGNQETTDVLPTRLMFGLVRYDPNEVICVEGYKFPVFDQGETLQFYIYNASSETLYVAEDVEPIYLVGFTSEAILREEEEPKVYYANCTSHPTYFLAPGARDFYAVEMGGLPPGIYTAIPSVQSGNGDFVLPDEISMDMDIFCVVADASENWQRDLAEEQLRLQREQLEFERQLAQQQLWLEQDRLLWGLIIANLR